MINLSAIKASEKLNNNTSSKFRQNLFIQKPDTFEHVSFTGSSNRIKQYNKTADTLIETGKNAQETLDEHLATEGWAAKVADSVSAIWSSKNRVKLVQEDINTYNSQMGELKESIKDKKFEEKFKDIFGVNFSQKNVREHEKKAKQFKLGAVAAATSEIIDKKLSKDLKTYEENGGKLKDKAEQKINPYACTGMNPYITVTTNKEKVFENLEKALVDVIGSKESLNNVLKASGVNAEKMSMEEKYTAYGVVGEFLVQSSEHTKKEILGKKTVAELKEEYNESYKKAYGTENDIQARVDKYNRSQEIGAATVRGLTRTVAVALSTLAGLPDPILLKALTTTTVATTAKIAIDASDKLSSQENLNTKNFKNVVKKAASNGAEYLASEMLYYNLPVISLGSGLLDFGISQAKVGISDTIVSFVENGFKKIASIFNKK